MIDTRFPTALQIVTSVAVNQDLDIRTTSGWLAQITNANASFVRKLFIPLRQANILTISTGGRGGISLSRPAAEISLADIYKAVAPGKRIWETRDDVPCVCFISRNINALSEWLHCESAARLLEALERVSVKDAIDNMRATDESNGELSHMTAITR